MIRRLCTRVTGWYRTYLKGVRWFELTLFLIAAYCLCTLYGLLWEGHSAAQALREAVPASIVGVIGYLRIPKGENALVDMLASLGSANLSPGFAFLQQSSTVVAAADPPPPAAVEGDLPLAAAATVSAMPVTPLPPAAKEELAPPIAPAIPIPPAAPATPTLAAAAGDAAVREIVDALWPRVQAQLAALWQQNPPTPGP